MASPSDPFVGLLVVEVVEAKSLPKMDRLGLSDPYTLIHFGQDVRLKTHTIMKNLNPVWNAKFQILVLNSQKHYNLKFDVYDWDLNSKDDFIGSVEFDISSVLGGKVEDQWLQLKNPKKHDHVGSIHVKLSVQDQKVVEKSFWFAFADHFDDDKTKTISFLEFTGMINSVGSKATNQEVEQLYSEGKLDKNNELSFDALYELMSSSEQNMKAHPILAKILTQDNIEYIWHVMEHVDDSRTSVGNFMLERGFYGKIKKEGEKDVIMVHNRKTGKLEEEKIPDYIKLSLKMMYSTHGGRFAVEGSQVKKVLRHLSEQQGKKYDLPSSKKEIEHFIEYHNLNKEEMRDPLNSFQNFNEFFYRKLKPNARPISEQNNPKVAVSAADCRSNFFPSIDIAKKVWIKGEKFNLTNLVGTQLAEEYDGASLVIFRLAPQDYHRFHVPVDGVIGKFFPHDGALFTVNPIAIREKVDVYTENKRIVTTINSPVFGNVLFIAVGATMVGSIHMTQKEGATVKKGDEMGYFAFGGSTVLTLFKPGTIKFDEDLLVNSGKPIETLLKVGDRIGISPK